MITKIGEYMIGEGKALIVYDFTFHINYIMSIDKDIEQGMDHGRDTHHDLTYENEQSTVTIPLKEYDSLKDQNKNILQTLL